MADEAVHLGQRRRLCAEIVEQGTCRGMQIRGAVDQRAVEVEYHRADYRGAPWLTG